MVTLTSRTRYDIPGSKVVSSCCPVCVMFPTSPDEFVLLIRLVSAEMAPCDWALMYNLFAVE